MISKSDIFRSYQSFKEDIDITSLVYSERLSELSGANVYLKLEHQQRTGSFKIRGVLSKMASLDKEQFNTTFVAASTGNHAAAFCYASEKYNFKAVLFLPLNVSKIKLDALEKFDVDIRLFGGSSSETEVKANEYAKEVGGILIHPYNDIEIIKGQGTLGIEIRDQLPEIDAVLIPVGGGGLISGIASYFKDDDLIEVIGCQPLNASEMHDSVLHNKIVPPSTKSTISDASAGGIEENAITFKICKQLVSRYELISEESTKQAVAFLVNQHQITVEPTAALPVAALMNSKTYKNRNVVLVLTGKKIKPSLLTEILNTYDYN